MDKKWFTITFNAKMNIEDIRAMNKYFYETMEKSMNINECAGLKIAEEKSYLDILNELQESVNTDIFPKKDKIQIDESIQKLFKLLYKYSN